MTDQEKLAVAIKALEKINPDHLDDQTLEMFANVEYSSQLKLVARKALSEIKGETKTWGMREDEA